MKLLAKILLFTFPLTCFGSDFIRLSEDESRNVIKQCSRYTPKQDVTEHWEVGIYFRDLVEENIIKVRELEPTHTRGKQTIRSLENYDFQLAGITIGNAKYVYINAVDRSIWKHGGSKNVAVNVCDGGNLTWGVIFNPSTKHFSRLAINDAV